MLKKILSVFLLTALGLSCFARQKDILNKQETINYLDKKIKEIKDHYRTPTGFSFPMYYRSGSATLSGEKVVINIESSNYASSYDGAKAYNCQTYAVRNTTQEFNPAHIVSISNGTTNKSDPLGIIIIKLVSKTGVSKDYEHGYTKINSSGNCYDWRQKSNHVNSINEIGLVFMQQDPDNFDKIRKALEHLKKLAKAEDDPFGD